MTEKSDKADAPEGVKKAVAASKDDGGNATQEGTSGLGQTPVTAHPKRAKAADSPYAQ